MALSDVEVSDRNWVGKLSTMAKRLLDQIEEAADEIRELRDSLGMARVALVALMLQAHDEGIPAAKIARAAGLSRERVRQLLERGNASVAADDEDED